MKTQYPLAILFFLVILISCKKTPKSIVDEVAIEKIDNVSSEAEKIGNDIDAKSKALEESLNELDNL